MSGYRDRRLDLIGIGVGPFNLSLAALLEAAPEVSSLFLDGKPEFSWHSGLLFDNATLQSPQVKDLVTLADPTSKFSFLNYLSKQNRLYRYIVSDYKNVRRIEFERYCKWVAGGLANVSFGSPVDAVEQCDDAFVVRSGMTTRTSRNLAIGVGRAPNIPPEFAGRPGASVFHGSEYLLREIPPGSRILVIGGGQTGAEIFYDLINRQDPPAALTWSTRRHNFVPFDESPFANELYIPGYSREFFAMSAERRAWLLTQQRFSSDAIVQGLLEAIYRRLYEIEFFSGGRDHIRLLADQHLVSVHESGGAWEVVTRTTHGEHIRMIADVVILATGYVFTIPGFLGTIGDGIHRAADGNAIVNEDFSVRWDGPPGQRIFVHNAALHTHGWIDPNFAGMAWRSATMVNAIANRQVYDLSETSTAVEWRSREAYEAAGQYPTTCPSRRQSDAPT